MAPGVGAQGAPTVETQIAPDERTEGSSFVEAKGVPTGGHGASCNSSMVRRSCGCTAATAPEARRGRKGPLMKRRTGIPLSRQEGPVVEGCKVPLLSRPKGLLVEGREGGDRLSRRAVAGTGHPETQNPKLETRNPDSGTRTPKP